MGLTHYDADLDPPVTDEQQRVIKMLYTGSTQGNIELVVFTTVGGLAFRTLK